jgi:hypothetical protein
MKKRLSICRIKILDFLTPQPEIQEEYVDKVVRLLRRDFNTSQQNEIILSITKKLSEEREKDMRKMEENYQVIQRDANFLKSKMVLQN